MNVYTKAYKVDPTRTKMLRDNFVREMLKRFRELKKLIRGSVYTQDVFGLKRTATKQIGDYTNLPGKEAFNFPRSADKVEAFMKWLKNQNDYIFLNVGRAEQLGTAIDQRWTDMYIRDSYQRGVIRARQEMKKAGLKVETFKDAREVEASLTTPVHMDRLGLLYTRTYEGIVSMTEQMWGQITRVLAQGIGDGDNPRVLAKKLLATVDGSNMGTLGITDSLGRFIPAERRAVILARTEIIRAHHQAMIQEYKNFGVAGVTVQAEWRTAGDERVCDICAALEGNVYTLEEANNLIPRHPQCFIDRQIPIYTLEGWKPIGDIAIGDLVLTHKKRFRKVYGLPRHKEKARVVTIKFKGELKLSMTDNHPVFTKTGDWIPVKECKAGDKIMILGNVCKRCGKSVPYFRTYCSRTCLSKDITDKQWSDPEHRKIIAMKNSIAMKKQYEDGSRDPYTITKAANKKTKQMIKEGVHPFQDPILIAKNKSVTNTPEHRQRSSERMSKNNPMKSPIVREKVRKSLVKYLEKNPEKRLNARMAKHRKSGRKTYIEQRMANLLDKLEIEYVFQYPILRYNVDFAIPELKIAIECDGEYWHRDSEKDHIRQERIEKEGWDVLRYTGAKINKQIDNIEHELCRIFSNHLGEYGLVEHEIESVRHWETKSTRQLYNLSVEEDESYIAKGVVVHNCRCLALPHVKGMGDKPKSFKERYPSLTKK